MNEWEAYPPIRTQTTLTVLGAGVLAVDETNATICATLNVPNGVRARLRFLRQAWDPAGDTFLWWALRINGVIQSGRGLGFQNQAYSGIGQELPAPAYDVAPGSVVEVLAGCLNGVGVATVNFWSHLEAEIQSKQG